MKLERTKEIKQQLDELTEKFQQDVLNAMEEVDSLMVENQPESITNNSRSVQKYVNSFQRFIPAGIDDSIEDMEN